MRRRSLLLPLLLLVQACCLGTQAQTSCADQLQRCGVVVEDFERQIQEIKNSVFKNCFSKPACLTEKVIFDDCYAKSIRAVRAPFNDDYSSLANDGFFDSAERYRSRLEQCFSGPSSHGSDFSSFPQDEDVIYARAVFGTKFADRLWGLPESDIGKPTLDSEGACLIKGYSSRVWGSGIGRVGESHNETCHFTTEETSCFRRSLQQDRSFQELLRSRDRALRNCVQSVRLQSQCRGSAHFRSCVCNAHEELENRLQASLLDCVRRSEIGHVYTVLIDGAGKGAYGNVKKVPPSADPRSSVRPPAASLPVHSPQAPATTISQGVLLNGQCLCACPQAAFPAQPTYPTQPAYPVARPFVEELLQPEPTWIRQPTWVRQPWVAPEQGAFWTPVQKREVPPQE